MLILHRLVQTTPQRIVTTKQRNTTKNSRKTKTGG